MKLDLTAYRTLVFDCDGVVLNSNRVKTEAFYQATLPYGEKAAKAMVEHHVTNGGISRYKKFAFFLDELVPAYSPGFKGPNLNAMLASYAKQVQHGLLTCDVAEGLEELRHGTPKSRWLIVSGGDQSELREIFSERGLAYFFDGGIFGSPDTKDEILARELSLNNIKKPALFLGDSNYDSQAAYRADIDFIFLSGWSEVFFSGGNVVKNINSLADRT